MNHATEYDAIVVGSGPNGLSAAISIAEKNKKVLLIEAAETIGGGMRTTELIESGFKHDVCSSVYPLVPPSPFFKNLLDNIDVELIKPDIAIAHVYSSEEAVPVYEDLKKTSAALGIDGPRYERLISPLLKKRLWTVRRHSLAVHPCEKSTDHDAIRLAWDSIVKPPGQKLLST